MAWIDSRSETSHQTCWREHGKIKKQSFPTREAAEKLKLEIERQEYRAAISARIDKATENLEETCRKYVASLNVAPITRAGYNRSVFKPFLEHFANRTIASLTTLDVQTYFATRRSAVAASTLGKEYSILKPFFRWATTHFLLPQDPCQFVKVRRVCETPGFCLTYAQEWKLIHTLTPYQLPKVLIARDCGIRASNIALLKRSALDLDARTLTFHVLKKGHDKPEQGKPLTLPLTNRLFEKLEGPFRYADPESYLFTYKGEQIKDPTSFLDDYIPRLGFTLRWHDLRHTFYTRLLEACDNYGLAEYAVGHSNKYWHPSPEKLRRAFDQFEHETENGFATLTLQKMEETK